MNSNQLNQSFFNQLPQNSSELTH